MSDLFGNHIVGFPTRRLKCVIRIVRQCLSRQHQSLGTFLSTAHMETQACACSVDTLAKVCNAIPESDFDLTNAC